MARERFDNGALGSLSGAATLADGDKYQIDISRLCRNPLSEKCRCLVDQRQQQPVQHSVIRHRLAGDAMACRLCID